MREKRGSSPLFLAIHIGKLPVRGKSISPPSKQPPFVHGSAAARVRTHRASLPLPFPLLTRMATVPSFRSTASRAPWLCHTTLVSMGGLPPAPAAWAATRWAPMYCSPACSTMQEAVQVEVDDGDLGLLLRQTVGSGYLQPTAQAKCTHIIFPPTSRTCPSDHSRRVPSLQAQASRGDPPEATPGDGCSAQWERAYGRLFGGGRGATPKSECLPRLRGPIWSGTGRKAGFTHRHNHPQLLQLPAQAHTCSAHPNTYAWRYPDTTASVVANTARREGACSGLQMQTQLTHGAEG